MRVLYVINGLGTGGAERSLAEMLPLLAERGIVPTVACLHRRTEGVQEEVIDSGFDVRFLTSRSLVRQARELRSLLDELLPSVVHTTIFDSDVVGRLAALGRPARVITSLVNTSYEPVRMHDPNVSFTRLRAAQLVDATTARRNDAFHALTTAVKDSAVRQLRLRPERITVIPRGRSGDLLGRWSEPRRQQARRSLGVGAKRRVLLSVGRQEFQKGQDVLIAALPAILRDVPDALLLIAGRAGGATAELRALSNRLGLERHVRWLGHRVDVPDLMCAADVLIFPSRYEGLGGTLIEAMALQLPIVASRVPAVEEIVGNAGVLVRPDDADAIVEATLATLQQRVDVVSIVHAARRRFLTEYQLEPVTDRLLRELYRVEPSSSTNVRPDAGQPN